MAFERVIQSIKARRQQATEQDTKRSISSARLVAGVIPETVSTVPVSQTVRISTGGDNSFQTGTNQSDRAQVPPATTNKVPRIYGQATTGGVIIDAAKTDGNTLIFAMVLSEMNRDGFDYFDGTSQSADESFSLTEIYRDNDQCGLQTPANSFGNAASKITTLTSLSTGNVVNISAANLINVWGWAGNSHANAQIFPAYTEDGTGNLYRKNAYDLFPNWTSSNTMDDLVFVICEVKKYEDPNVDFNIKNFGDFRFTISSKGDVDQNRASALDKPLTNPAYALWDYLTDDRYGVGLSNADIDTASLEAWADHCAENECYRNTSNTVVSADRFRIDGFINTQNTVAENIKIISECGMGTFTYDDKQGKFRVLVNRAMSASEKANAFSFNSDNIVSSITVSNTDLYS